MRTPVHEIGWYSGKPLALIAVFAALILTSLTHAAIAADEPATDTLAGSGHPVKATKVKYAGLPHRQEWELFRQANSPARDCPGATAMLIDVEGTLFFLECQRIHP